jgi:hypothetical protein
MTMIEELLNTHTDEIWKPVVIRGTVVPGYCVSNHGRITGKKGQFMKINPRECKERGNASMIGITVPKDLFSDYDYKHDKQKPNAKTRKLTCQVHQLVMEAFSSTDENESPPIPKEDWEHWPESAKKYITELLEINKILSKKIKTLLVIDHIDDNPFNNHISNLRRVVPRDNNTHVKKYKLNDISRSGSYNSLV